MQSTSTAGFLDESKRGILNKFISFKSLPDNCTEEERVVIRVQRAWRKRLQKYYLPALKQAHVCQDYRKQFDDNNSASYCSCCARGESTGKYIHHVESLQFSGISKMLFQNQHRQNV